MLLAPNLPQFGPKTLCEDHLHECHSGNNMQAEYITNQRSKTYTQTNVFLVSWCLDLRGSGGVQRDSRKQKADSRKHKADSRQQTAGSKLFFWFFGLLIFVGLGESRWGRTWLQDGPKIAQRAPKGRQDNLQDGLWNDFGTTFRNVFVNLVDFRLNCGVLVC